MGARYKLEDHGNVGDVSVMHMERQCISVLPIDDADVDDCGFVVSYASREAAERVRAEILKRVPTARIEIVEN